MRYSRRSASQLHITRLSLRALISHKRRLARNQPFSFATLRRTASILQRRAPPLLLWYHIMVRGLQYAGRSRPPCYTLSFSSHVLALPAIACRPLHV